jgi:putative DNA primase/helicase
MGGDYSKLDYALAHARHGFRVFACHEIEADGECSCGKLQCASAGKHPRIKDWQILATTDESEIRKWWRQWSGANIGIATGESSNLTVLDVDGEVVAPHCVSLN